MFLCGQSALVVVHEWRLDLLDVLRSRGGAEVELWCGQCRPWRWRYPVSVSMEGELGVVALMPSPAVERQRIRFWAADPVLASVVVARRRLRMISGRATLGGVELSSQRDVLVGALCALHWEIGGVYADVARQFGVTAQQARLLCLMEQRRPSFVELAGILGCDKTNVTGMVARLQERGLLRRESDALDGRISRVVVTEQGLALAGRLREALEARVAGGLCGLSVEDRQRLADLAGSAALALADDHR